MCGLSLSLFLFLYSVYCSKAVFPRVWLIHPSIFTSFWSEKFYQKLLHRYMKGSIFYGRYKKVVPFLSNMVYIKG